MQVRPQKLSFRTVLFVAPSSLSGLGITMIDHAPKQSFCQVEARFNARKILQHNP